MRTISGLRTLFGEIKMSSIKFWIAFRLDATAQASRQFFSQWWQLIFVSVEYVSNPIKIISTSCFLVSLSGCASMDDKGWESFGNILDKLAGAVVAADQAGRPQSSTASSYESAPQVVGFFKGQRVSGTNRICYYDRLGSLAAITVGIAEICPLTMQ
jgi:hypothetical protein